MTDPRITREITDQPVAAVATTEGGRWTLRLERQLDHEPERVWRMLTEPDQLARWSPFVPDRVLDGPGQATARETPQDEPLDAEVLVHDPPRELVHRWGGDVLRWVLSATDRGTRLTLHHTVEDPSGMASYAAGWHVCLATLVAVLDGADVPRVIGAAAESYGWDRLRDAYDALGVTG